MLHFKVLCFRGNTTPLDTTIISERARGPSQWTPHVPLCSISPPYDAIMRLLFQHREAMCCILCDRRVEQRTELVVCCWCSSMYRGTTEGDHHRAASKATTRHLITECVVRGNDRVVLVLELFHVNTTRSGEPEQGTFNRWPLFSNWQVGSGGVPGTLSLLFILNCKIAVLLIFYSYTTLIGGKASWI